MGWKQPFNMMWKNTMDSTCLEYGLVGGSYDLCNNFWVCPDEWLSASQETYSSIQMVYKIWSACSVKVHYQNEVPEIWPSSLVSLHLYTADVMSLWYSWQERQYSDQKVYLKKNKKRILLLRTATNYLRLYLVYTIIIKILWHIRKANRGH
jgi:hypothetical protein